MMYKKGPKRRWTPVEIEVLLKCYYSGERNNGIPDATSYRDARDMWGEGSFIEPCPGDESGRFITTPKGQKMVEMICDTPMPENKWADSRKKRGA